jgi:monoterpene epsilon-lactone hydrolase
MKYIKRILISVIILIAVIALGYVAINTTIFKPSLGSRLARIVIKKTFHTVQSMREAENSIVILDPPAGTIIEKVDVEGMNAEWVRAATVEPKSGKVVLYFHGGGFIIGSCATYRDLAARISKSAGVPVLVIEYRLAPEHKYPAANNDCIAAYRWLLKQGFKPGDIAFGGDSAGGSLALMTLLSLRETGGPLPAAVFLLSPLTDLVHFDGESYKTRVGSDPVIGRDNMKTVMEKNLAPFIGDIKTKPAILSPVRQNLAGLPPMLIQVGNDEVLLSDSTRLAERAKRAGVDVTIQVWDHMWHVFQVNAIFVPEARQAIGDIGVFLKKHLKIN